MILIHTERGILEIPCPPADDSQSIQGKCFHGVSLFDECSECEEVAR